MVYDWEGKESTMRDLYIDQGKSLEEVMEWFRVNQDFAPRYVVLYFGETFSTGDEVSNAGATVTSAPRRLIAPHMLSCPFGILD